MNKTQLLWQALTVYAANELGLPENNLDGAAVAKILGEVFKWGGILAVIMIIVGGVIYTVSAGDETRLRQAKAIIQYSVIGLIVMILAFAIVTFVIGAL